MPGSSAIAACFCPLCMVAAGLCAHAGAATVSSPAILRTDAFIATPYDANTALVFFSSNALVPASVGVPAGALPKPAITMAGGHAQLRLENSSGEPRWRHYWRAASPMRRSWGQQYVLAVGEHLEHGMVSSLGYLKVCDVIWMVGLVTIEETDRYKYAQWSLPAGMVAYPEPEGGVPALKPILDRDEFAKLPAKDVMGDDKSFTIFPLDALPMLDQGDRDAGDQRILLTQQQTAGGRDLFAEADHAGRAGGCGRLL